MARVYVSDVMCTYVYTRVYLVSNPVKRAAASITYTPENIFPLPSPRPLGTLPTPTTRPQPPAQASSCLLRLPTIGGNARVAPPPAAGAVAAELQQNNAGMSRDTRAIRERA